MLEVFLNENREMISLSGFFLGPPAGDTRGYCNRENGKPRSAGVPPTVWDLTPGSDEPKTMTTCNGLSIPSETTVLKASNECR